MGITYINTHFFFLNTRLIDKSRFYIYRYFKSIKKEMGDADKGAAVCYLKI